MNEEFDTVRERGNLGLCQNTECMGKSSSGAGVMKAPIEGETSLQWRFEDGLLRALDLDGYATDRCLGPSATSLERNHVTPYGLVLQACPDTTHENIFAHHDENNLVTSRTIENDDKKAYAGIGRHMRFVVVGDGNIQSLAPVRGEADSAFCVTAMTWGSIGDTNAFLAPCLSDRREQVFDIDAGSSFEPFLLNLQSADERIVEFAYQLGYDGASSNAGGFDSYVINVTCDCDKAFLSEVTLPGGSSPTSGTLSLSLSDFDMNGSDVVGRLEAHLMGISRDELKSRSSLASTSFTVSESAYESITPFPLEDGDDALVTRIVDDGVVNAKGFPKSVKVLFCFLGFMLFYMILVMATSIFCPSRATIMRRRRKKKAKNEKRDSDLTAATMEEAVNRMNSEGLDWGRTSVDSAHSSILRTSVDSAHSSILYRITEELDPQDIEYDTSSYGEPTFSDAGNTYTDTTAETEDFLDISMESNENDIEALQ